MGPYTHSPGLALNEIVPYPCRSPVSDQRKKLADSVSHFQLTVLAVCSQVTWSRVEDEGVAASARLLV